MLPHDNSTDWDEYEWEKALRESDKYAARYFKLLKRFCDLPAGNELIEKYMGPEFSNHGPECDFDCDTCKDRWTCDFAINDDDNDDDWNDMPSLEEFEQAEDAPVPAEPGDILFYEAAPPFIILRQTSIGWSNIYAAILPPDSRLKGLRILYELGRSLANIAYSVGDGLYEQPAGSVAFAKRSLNHLNRGMGLLKNLTKEKPRLHPLIQTIQGHMLKSREMVLQHLNDCRERYKNQD